MLSLASFEWRVAPPAAVGAREWVGPHTRVDARGVAVTDNSWSFGGGSLPINILGELEAVEDPDLPLRTYLTCGREWGQAGRGQKYWPERDAPGLFREFAALPAEPEAMEAFANRYGLLGVWHVLRGDWSQPNRVLAARRRHERDEDSDLLIGEPLSLWREEMEALAWCVSVLDGLRAPDRARVEGLLEARPSPSDLLPRDLSSYQIGTTSRGVPAWQARAHQGLQAAITTRISRWCPLGLSYEPRKSVLRLVPQPKNLLAFIWMQLTNEIDSDARFLGCACGCGKWFPKDARGRKQYFDHACRQRVLRRKALEGGQAA